MFEKRYAPVFSGKTEAGEKIVVYRKLGHGDDLFILRPDGELWALSPGSEVTTWVDSDGLGTRIHVRIESPEWTGTATGTKEDQVREEPR